MFLDTGIKFENGFFINRVNMIFRMIVAGAVDIINQRLEEKMVLDQKILRFLLLMNVEEENEELPKFNTFEILV